MAAPSKPGGTRKTPQRAGRPGSTSKTIAIPTQKLEIAVGETEDVEVPDTDVLELSTKVENEDNPYAAREVVFTIDGKEYTAPIAVPASKGLEFLSIKYSAGSDFAGVWAMQDSLGVEAVQKLCSVPTLTPEQLAVITLKISGKYTDATAVPKGRLKSV